MSRYRMRMRKKKEWYMDTEDDHMDVEDFDIYDVVDLKIRRRENNIIHLNFNKMLVK
jgi:hypothetical protein